MEAIFLNDNKTKALETMADLATTTRTLIGYLAASDEDRSHEAISVLLMQGVHQLGPESVAMQQFFPVFDTIKRRIDASDFQGALWQAKLFQNQLDEIISLLHNR